VLDFVNEQKDIEASFQDYYQRTELEGATDPDKLYNLIYTLEQMRVFTPEDVTEFVELFVVKKVKSEKLQPFFQCIVTGKGSDGSIVRNSYYDNLAVEHLGSKDYEKLKAAAKDKFRKEIARYVKQYSFISQIMTFTDTRLEKFYLFAKLLLRQLPYEKQTLPLEVIEMIDMDKYRVQEEQNGRITLKDEDGVLELSPDDGHRGGEPDMEKLKLIVKKLNEDFGIPFEEADRVMNAIKAKLEDDDGLRAAFKTNSIEFLRKQKLQDSIKEAFLSNADEFLNFMSKTETDTGFGKFFFSEMFKWYEDSMKAGKPPV
jgi:type I restriction enzyme R subunit